MYACMHVKTLLEAELEWVDPHLTNLHTSLLINFMLLSVLV